MKVMVFALLLLGILSGNAHASSQSQALTLKEAVHYALEHSPSFDAAAKTETVRDLEYRNSFAKLLPSLDLSSTAGLQNNIPIASTVGTNSLLTPNPSAPWYSSINLGITENLYDNGVSLTNLSIAELNRSLSAVSALKARDNLTLEIAAEFYKYSLAKSVLDVKLEQEKILDKQFRTLNGEYHQGFKTKSDFLRLKTQVQRAEIDRISAENNIQLAVTELRRLLGVGHEGNDLPGFEPATIQSRSESDSMFPEHAPDFDSVYDYRITKIQEEINDKSIGLARRKYWPQLSFTSGVNYSNQNFLNGNTPFAAGHQLSWNALFNLQYNLWDWGARRRDVDIAALNRDILGDALHQTRLDTGARISALMADLKRVSRSYQLSHELMGFEEESNRSLQAQYREGKVTYLDFITSVNSLLDAKIQFYTSYFDSLQGIAKYKYYEGKIYETLVE